MAMRMSGKDSPVWQDLRVGDRIRLVATPSVFRQESYFVHRDTMNIYKKLLARRRALRVCKIDEDGVSWIRCRFHQKDGGWEWHSLAFNHDGFVRVDSPRRGGSN